jgi:hypothetical protein
LDTINRQLDRVDANENQIERFFSRDALFEGQAGLQAEIDELTPRPEPPETAHHPSEPDDPDTPMA